MYFLQDHIRASWPNDSVSQQNKPEDFVCSSLSPVMVTSIHVAYLRFVIKINRLGAQWFRFVVLPSSTSFSTVCVEGFYFHLITLKHTPQSVGLLWTRDRPVAKTST
jgi:ABC-type tungstate transport system substrate-binding protein